jgi:leucyl aminopeptidase (aminopeptidase T)
MNLASTHIDGVIGQPTLEIDGALVMVNGEYLGY